MKKNTFFLVLGLLTCFMSFGQNITNPDINDGLVNTPIPGNVATNDIVPAGTTYGTPTGTGNPSADVPVMNPNGTYTFIPSVAGVYTFNVPVCVPNAAIPCPTMTLVITVTTVGAINPPIANNDLGQTPINTSVTINIRANDTPGAAGQTLSSPTIVIQPTNGTAVVNPGGTITYIPNTGYSGSDSFIYNICEMPSGFCDTATVSITVLPIGSSNTILAVDDYSSTLGEIHVFGNVLVNDINPDDNTAITIIPQNISLPEGTFILSANGTYVFTAAPGFIGTVSIPYIIYDGIVPPASSSATLYIVVQDPNLNNNNFTFNNLNYFPNPVKNNLTISNTSIIDEVEITSVLGQKMISKKINDLQTEINLSELANGVYFVKITSNGQEKTIKIVKE